MPLSKELKKVGHSIGAAFDGRGRHNLVPYELESGMVIICSYCGWKKDDCKNKKNCSGNPDGPYAKLLQSVIKKNKL